MLAIYFRIANIFLMKKKLFILLLSIITTAAHAEFSTRAKSAFLIDYDSGTELVAKNADTLMPPSSMIKLMTLAVLFDEIKSGNLTMDDRLTVSENADYENPFKMVSRRILRGGSDRFLLFPYTHISRKIG